MLSQESLMSFTGHYGSGHSDSPPELGLGMCVRSLVGSREASADWQASLIDPGVARGRSSGVGAPWTSLAFLSW